MFLLRFAHVAQAISFNSYLCMKQEVNMEKERILVVDDEPTIRQLLKINLELEGYEVTEAGSAEEVLRMGLKVRDFSLILLDVMLGEVSGFDLAGKLRDSVATRDMPIIFCTALSDTDDEVHGLDLGGEDYVTKPFSMRTLVARVKRTLRNKAQSREPRADSGITLDEEAKSAIVQGVPVALTPNEFGLLKAFLSNPGRVFSRGELLDLVRGPGVVVTDRTIDVNIFHLRKKISPYSSCITTRPGFGYVFTPENQESRVKSQEGEHSLGESGEL